MAGAVVQVVYASDSNFTTNTTTIAATLTVTSGSTLLVYTSNDSGGGSKTCTVADNVNAGGYTAIDDDTFTANTSHLLNFYHSSCAAGSTTVTGTFSANTVAKFIIVVELSGVGALDVHSGTGGVGDQTAVGSSADLVVSGSITPSSQPGILIGCSLDLGGGTPQAGTGFTAGSAGITFGGAVAALALVESKTISSTSAVQAKFTASIAARDHQTFATYFLDASSGNTGTGSNALSSLAASGSGAETFTGTGSNAVSQLAASASGAETFSGTGTAALSQLAITASGAGIFQGSGSLAVSSLAIAATGTITPAFTGTGSLALSSLAETASGSETFTATGSAAVKSLAASGSGSETFAATGSLALSSLGATGSSNSTFPLVYSADSRYLVTATGAPFPIKGRALWNILQLIASERDSVLDDTVAKKWNACEMRFINSAGSGGTRAPKANNSTLLPFTKRLDGTAWTGSMTYGNINNEAPDMSFPDSSYWAFVDDFMAAALARGILVMAFPSYVGFAGSTQGWMAEMVANGTTKMQAYGAFVADRYRSYPNIVWMIGGDCGTGAHTFTAGQIAVEQAMIDGMASVSSQSSVFIAAEWNTGSKFTDNGDFTYSPPYIPLNSCYSFTGDVNTIGRGAYSTDTIPAFLLEEPYDEEGPDGNNVNANATQPVRRFQWWGWLSTIGGHNEGNGRVWPFNHTGAATDWDQHLNTTGAQDMARLNGFIDSKSWWLLKPSGLDGMRTLIPSGGGSGPSDTAYIAAACHTDLLVAYVPPAAGSAHTFTVDLRSMGTPLAASWFDPTNGSYVTNASAAGTFTLANTASAQSFTTPSANSAAENDFVLVVATANNTGTGSAALSQLAISAAGGLSFSASGSLALSSLAASGAGGEAFSGSATAQVSSLAAVASASETFTGTATAQVSSLAATGSGTYTAPPTTGTGTIALSSLNASGTNILPSGVNDPYSSGRKHTRRIVRYGG